MVFDIKAKSLLSEKHLIQHLQESSTTLNNTQQQLEYYQQIQKLVGVHNPYAIGNICVGELTVSLIKLFQHPK